MRTPGLASVRQMQGWTANQRCSLLAVCGERCFRVGAVCWRGHHPQRQQICFTRYETPLTLTPSIDFDHRECCSA
jgi:hypothetical protein